jgi:hypothetical protein
MQYLCHSTTKAAEAKINPLLKHIYIGTINIMLNTKYIFLRLLDSLTIT